MYLATVIDCYTRQLTGFAIADHMRTELVEEALTMARRECPILCVRGFGLQVVRESVGVSHG